MEKHESSIYRVNSSSPLWPRMFREMREEDIPHELYIRGVLPEHSQPIIGIVGSRRPSRYGSSVAYGIARKLADHGVIIVSGMALGIDAISHKAALDSGTPTIAVLGSGISDEVIYPRTHLPIAKNIIKHGGSVLSETDPNEKATKYSFPKRNRIIAGMCDALVVIEAGEKSGTLITARFAAEYGRDVFAVPGSIYSDQSKGTNQLLRDGAHVLTSAKDILEKIHYTEQMPTLQKNLNEDEIALLSVCTEECTLDDMIQKTGHDTVWVMRTASSLEMKGCIKNIGNGTFHKLS